MHRRITFMAKENDIRNTEGDTRSLVDHTSMESWPKSRKHSREQVGQ